MTAAHSRAPVSVGDRPFRLAEVAAPPAWMTDAACLDSPELPWIEEQDLTRGYPRQVMARICAACPVLVECDQYARSTRAIAGFWAGRTRYGERGNPQVGPWPPGVAGPGQPTHPETTDPANEPTAPAPTKPRPAPAPSPAPTGPGRQIVPAQAAGRRMPTRPGTLQSPADPERLPGHTDLVKPPPPAKEPRMDRPNSPTVRQTSVALAELTAAVNDALYRYEQAVRAGDGSSTARVALYAAVEELYRHAKQLHEANARLAAARGAA